MGRTMKIYTVSYEDAIEGSIACASLAEALQLRRDDCEPGDGEISRHTVAIDRVGLCGLFNRDGWAIDSVVVKPAKPRRALED